MFVDRLQMRPIEVADDRALLELQETSQCGFTLKFLHMVRVTKSPQIT